MDFASMTTHTINLHTCKQYIMASAELHIKDEVLVQNTHNLHNRL